MQLGEEPTDFRGTPIREGALVLFPCDAHAGGMGRSVQLGEGVVQAVEPSGGLTVEVLRRSRTGRPGVRGRSLVHLRNIANVAVIG